MTRKAAVNSHNLYFNGTYIVREGKTNQPLLYVREVLLLMELKQGKELRRVHGEIEGWYCQDTSYWDELQIKSWRRLGTENRHLGKKHPRQKEQHVQKPRGRNEPEMSEDQQEGQCCWNEASEWDKQMERNKDAKGTGSIFCRAL